MPNAKTGKLGVHFKPTPVDLAVNPQGNFSVPCGKCLGCQSDRRRDWCNRMMLELSLHDSGGTFLTLTYRDAPPSLQRKHVQDFLKRLRNAERDYSLTLPKPLRYFFCGERGSKRGRPHYHGLLFGLDMMREEWQPYIATFKDGYPVYSSRVLERIWPFGFNVVGSIDYCAIRYVSKYIVKTIGQEDSFTLKSIGLGSDFFFNSRRVGRKIHRWYKASARSLFADGIVHLPFRGDSIAVPIPHAYDRYIGSFAPDDLEQLKLLRRQYAINSSVDIAARAAWLRHENRYKPNERRLDYDEEGIFHP